MSVPTGPEDVPLKDYIKTLPIIILIYDLKQDKLIREERIDYSNADERRWLGRISFWAISNNHSVETMSLTDYEKYEKNK